MVQAVYDSNPSHFGLKSNPQVPNKPFIKNHLRKLQRDAIAGINASIKAWDDLTGYWEMAVRSSPEVKEIEEQYKANEYELFKQKFGL